MSNLIQSLTQEIERTCEILLEDRAINENRLLAFKKGLECILECCLKIRWEDRMRQEEKK